MKKLITFSVALILINITLMRRAESSTLVEITDKGNMPYCVHEAHNGEMGVAFSWDKSTKKIPRDIYYSAQSCKKTTPFSKKIKIHFENNLPPKYIEQLELSSNVQLKLQAVRAGVNKFINPSDLTNVKFLNSLFGQFNKDTNKTLINNYHINLSSKLFHNWISLKKLPNDCSSLIGTCEYYLCRESQKSCNIDGYFLGFGYQYCSESLVNLSSKVSTKAQSWLKDVAICLQNKMESISNDNSCADIKDQAIKSHDECYTETEFCSLDFKDAYKIIKMLRPEFDDKRIIKEGLEVLKSCRI